MPPLSPRRQGRVGLGNATNQTQRSQRGGAPTKKQTQRNRGDAINAESAGRKFSLRPSRLCGCSTARRICADEQTLTDSSAATAEEFQCDKVRFGFLCENLCVLCVKIGAPEF